MTLNDEYDILGIYNGAFATVYKARHRRLGYVRAVKELKDAIISEQDRAYQTFLKECKVLMQIGNGYCPNIVRMYSPRLLGNHAVVEMDFIEGPTLVKYLNDNHFMPIDEVMRLIKEIGGALAYCHHDIYKFLMNPSEDHLNRDPNDATKYVITSQKERELINKYRIVHNDIHSGNVMRRNQDGSYVLLDFGLAIQNGHAVKSSSRNQGAYEYKAPEKWDMALSDDVPPQCDIYSFGILLFEALTGRVPFEFDPDKFSNELAAQNEMRRLHHTEPVPAIEPLRRKAFHKTKPTLAWIKDYPDWLEQMVQKCLAKDPADRYADAYELMEDFNRHSATAPTTDTQREEELQHKVEQLEKEIARLKQNGGITSLAEFPKPKAETPKPETNEKKEPVKPSPKRSRGWMIAAILAFVGLCIAIGVIALQNDYTPPPMPEPEEEEEEVIEESKGPSATVENVWVSQNQSSDYGVGMTIHVKFNVKQMMSRELMVLAYFYDSNNNKLIDTNHDICSKYGTDGENDSQVCVSKTMTPSYEDSHYDDLELFIPYGELHQTKNEGPKTLKFKISMRDKEAKEFIYQGDYHEFTLDPTVTPFASIDSVRMEHNQMVDGVKTLKVHMKLCVNGMKGKEFSSRLWFYQNDNSTKLLDKNGDQVGSVKEKGTPSYICSVWKDWVISIPNDDFLGATNHEDENKKCSFDIVVKDDNGDVLTRVENIKIQKSQD